MMQLLIAACVVINFKLSVVPILVSNLSADRLTSLMGKMLADDTALKTRRVNSTSLFSTELCGFRIDHRRRLSGVA